jgi:hypothetical protein
MEKSWTVRLNCVLGRFSIVLTYSLVQHEKYFFLWFLIFSLFGGERMSTTGKFSHLIEQERVTEKGGRELPGIRNTMVRDLLQSNNRGRILGQNPDKSLSSFRPCYSVTSTALP